MRRNSNGMKIRARIFSTSTNSTRKTLRFLGVGFLPVKIFGTVRRGRVWGITKEDGWESEYRQAVLF